MRNLRFNISLYLIIPLIASGTVALAMIITYEITASCLRKGQDPFWPAAFWGIIMLLLAGGIGFLIVRIIIGPLERFVRKAETLGVVREKRGEKDAADDMTRFTYVFDQVTELLSGVEARKLFPLIAGGSREIRGVLNRIIKVAPTDSTVLILGETGTGKELVARSIYEHSRRKNKPFITLNCAAIPAGLIESELFGHEKGAFTDAGAKKTGRFELADQGTIFLDEIGAMPLETQAKLLRVLENRYIERVGGSKQIRVDVRIIAATNRNLEEMVKQKKFRRDLFYRLNVFSIIIPPLRERKEDIPVIADHFIKKLSKSVKIAPESMNILSSYNWPGNVRELQNVIESASITAEERIDPAHILSLIARDPREANFINASDNSGHNIDQRIREYEKGIIIAALERAGGVQVRAARMLGIKERSLWHRIKKYGIDVSSFKGGDPETT
jgi:transcriptional regulator with GAF, ATPase, and Fis domain